MLAGLDMQMEATLNLICDMAAEIVSYDRGAVFLWEEETQVMHVRVTRNLQEDDPLFTTRSNVLNFWTAKMQRPLLLNRGMDAECDSILGGLGCVSALVIPLFVEQRVLGSLQLYGDDRNPFTAEDAQLLWMLVLVAEKLLTHDYGNEALLRFAFTDFLTGLKTRGFFEQQLEMELKRAERRGSELSLLMIDIDYFKKLNDTHGHNAGDQLLRDLTSILVKDLREIDTAARYGGEEFVIILPETAERAAHQVASRLRRSVAQTKFFAGTPDKVVQVTISIGLAVYKKDASYKRDLIEAADAALYQAKARGRDQVVLFSEMQKQKLG